MVAARNLLLASGLIAIANGLLREVCERLCGYIMIAPGDVVYEIFMPTITITELVFIFKVIFIKLIYVLF
jgi:hypothetical protein